LSKNGYKQLRNVAQDAWHGRDPDLSRSFTSRPKARVCLLGGARRHLKFHKRSQLFIGAQNKTLSVAAMRVSNKDRPVSFIDPQSREDELGVALKEQILSGVLWPEIAETRSSSLPLMQPTLRCSQRLRCVMHSMSRLTGFSGWQPQSNGFARPLQADESLLYLCYPDPPSDGVTFSSEASILFGNRRTVGTT
jgi:hypothetical protein